MQKKIIFTWNIISMWSWTIFWSIQSLIKKRIKCWKDENKELEFFTYDGKNASSQNNDPTKWICPHEMFDCWVKKHHNAHSKATKQLDAQKHVNFPDEGPSHLRIFYHTRVELAIVATFFNISTFSWKCFHFFLLPGKMFNKNLGFF